MAHIEIHALSVKLAGTFEAHVETLPETGASAEEGRGKISGIVDDT